MWQSRLANDRTSKVCKQRSRKARYDTRSRATHTEVNWLGFIFGRTDTLSVSHLQLVFYSLINDNLDLWKVYEMS